MRRHALGLALEIAVPILLLVAFGVWSANAGSFFFPPLTKILSTFQDTWLFARVGSDVVPSLARMFAGFFIAVAVAVSLGVLLGLSRTAQRAASPIVEFMRAIPPRP